MIQVRGDVAVAQGRATCARVADCARAQCLLMTARTQGVLSLDGSIQQFVVAWSASNWVMLCIAWRPQMRSSPPPTSKFHWCS